MRRARARTAPGAPLLDIASYARRGPGRAPLAAAQLQLIARTVRRTPEVMVKVLRHGGTDQGAVQRHIDYLTRKGALELETDDGQRLLGRNAEKQLLADWNLDVELGRPGSRLAAIAGRPTPRLVHKLLFSMPARTAPDKVYAAVQAFCREEFALKHRYAMVLHTDESHPHVHVVVKAVSEQGQRLNIKKANLRDWRAEFAKHLRLQGVAANATDRAVRGSPRLRKSDGIFRAMGRGDSTHLRAQLRQLTTTSAATRGVEKARERLTATRREVEAGWRALALDLERGGEPALAAEVRSFASALPKVLTDQELILLRKRSGFQEARGAQKPAEPDRTPG